MGTGEVTPPRQLSTARSSHLLLELDAGRQLLRAKHKTVQHHAVYEKLLRQASDLLFALSFKFHYQRQVIRKLKNCTLIISSGYLIRGAHYSLFA